MKCTTPKPVKGFTGFVVSIKICDILLIDYEERTQISIVADSCMPVVCSDVGDNRYD